MDTIFEESQRDEVNHPRVERALSGRSPVGVEGTVGRTSGDMLGLTRAWKLFCCFHDVVVSTSQGGLVPKGRLLERVSLFHNGHWSEKN